MGGISSKQRTLLISVISIALVLGLSALLALNLNLGTSKAKADTSSGEFSYSVTDLAFSANGELLGKPQLRGSSVATAYSTSVFKSLTALKFKAQNLPLNSLVRFCVESLASDGYNDQVICRSTNLVDSASAEWTMSLAKAILVDADHDYYCSAELELLGQTDTTEESATVFACELNFAPIANADLLLPLNSNLFSQTRQGVDLAPDIDFVASKDLRFSGMYASLGVDTSLAEQTLADICLMTAATKVCWPDFSFAANANKVSADLIQEIKLDLKSGDTFRFSCTTQEGRRGNCQIFAYMNISPDTVRALTEPKLVASEYARLVGSDATAYCAEDLIYYENDVNFSESQGDSAKQMRCAALLAAK